PDQYYVVSVRAPHDLHPYGHAWYAINFDDAQNKFSDNAQARSSRDLIARFIDELVTDLPVDPREITLIGFSQGAILSYAVALSYPEKIKNVIALSGYLNTDILGDAYEENDFSRLNMFISHGISDQVIPVDWARKAPDLLRSLGIGVTYREYPIGHGVSPQNFYDLKNWLENN
ncbi:MAG TPA: alpha/beta fold hydrolase, partial [Flavobacterium sp.]|nr:alpha/beta fold hydrolase [Flavobacterium sp.]